MSLAESGGFGAGVSAGIPLGVRVGFLPQELSVHGTIFNRDRLDFQSNPKPPPTRPPPSFPSSPKRPEGASKTPSGKTRPPKKAPREQIRLPW